MDVLGLETYRPVRPAASMGAAPGAKAALTASAEPVLRDSADLTGAFHPAPDTATAEQLLGALHESGLVESASRALTLPEGAPDAAEHGSATVTVALEGSPEAAGTEAGNETEWRPYQPPTEPEPTVTADGKSLVLTLYGMANGDGSVLDLGALALPLDLDGALLAQLMDGTFRLLTLNQGMLDGLLQAGTLHVDSFTPPPPEQTALPSGGGRGIETVRPDPAPWAEQLTLPQLPVGEGQEALARWADMHAAAQRFETVTERWLAQTEEPLRAEARTQLQSMRREWAAELEREDPALFRAWLEVGVKSYAEQGRLDDAAVPLGFTAEDDTRWTAPERWEATPPSKDSGQNWLRALFPRLFPPEGTEQRSVWTPHMAYLAAEAGQAARGDDSILTRRIALYLQQLVSGHLRYSAEDSPALARREQEPEGDGGEARGRAWKRRQIGLEVDNSWTENLRGWLTHVDGWRVSRCQNYVNSKANDWTTELMNTQPAGFRHWLSSPLRHAASTGWFNRATGSFPINTLPEGFSDADFQRWLALDVLDYL